MGYISKDGWSCLGLINPTFPYFCEPVICLSDCEECYIPFVNATKTATRYPRRALVTVTHSATWRPVSGIPSTPPPPECGLCGDCSLGAGTQLLRLWQSGDPSSTSTSPWWTTNVTDPAAGPFTFAGVQQLDACRVERLDNEACAVAGPVWNGTGYDCEADGFNAPRLAELIIWQSAGEWFAQCLTADSFTSDPLSLGFGEAVDTPCEEEPVNGLILPGSLSFTGFTTSHVVENYICDGDGAATAIFYDWVERPFPA